MNTSPPALIADALAQVLGNGTSPKAKIRTRILGGTECAPVALAVGQPTLPGSTPETLVIVAMGLKSVCSRTTPEQTLLHRAVADLLLTELSGEDGRLETACGNIVKAFEDDLLQTPAAVEMVAQLGLWVIQQTPYGAAIASGAYRECMLKIEPMEDAKGRYDFGLYLAEHDGSEGEAMQ